MSESEFVQADTNEAIVVVGVDAAATSSQRQNTRSNRIRKSPTAKPRVKEIPYYGDKAKPPQHREGRLQPRGGVGRGDRNKCRSVGAHVAVTQQETTHRKPAYPQLPKTPSGG
jgi:hypothetical protein